MLSGDRPKHLLALVSFAGILTLISFALWPVFLTKLGQEWGLTNTDIGWISGKSMSKEIFLIVKNMKIGEVSKPIKRQNSILFLKLKDKRLSNTDNLDLIEVKKKIINRKKNELFNLYSNSYLSKLKNTSLIEYK